MLTQLLDILASWSPLDTWTVVTGALAAMACALPGTFLLLKRQSMMGDALSHTVLLGVVLAFIAAQLARDAGWIESQVYDPLLKSLMFFGAMAIGVVAAVLTELIQKLGRVEASAALGVVFTSFFALGLLLIRLIADSVHIDPDCVLYGNIETIYTDRIGVWQVPRAAVSHAIVLLVNAGLVILFFKELRLVTFDPELAMAMGIPAAFVHHGLMAVTAATLVMAFESVGSILVIGMLIVPAATASLLTDRLRTLLVLALLIAAGSALVGHAAAITLPALIFARLGVPQVVDASTAGMMAVAGGLFFLMAAIAAPRYGIISRWLNRRHVSRQIADDDLLALLFRIEESGAAAEQSEPPLLAERLHCRLGEVRGTIRRLVQQGCLETDVRGACHLTAAGRQRGAGIVRSHRLWETYVATHFDDVDDRRLHRMASEVEHYIDEELRSQLDDELNQPRQDPHGQAIPNETPRRPD